jgi:hypothetical protein
MAGERFYWDTARLARQLGVPALTGVREDEAVASV